MITGILIGLSVGILGGLACFPNLYDILESMFKK